MADQLTAKGVKLKCPLLVTPGSEQVRATIERDGFMAKLEALGATVLANACGPCIGMWQRHDIKEGESNSIISSYNRNFPKRNDGNAATCSFLCSPETVLAYAIFGRLDIDPFTTPIEAADGSTFTLNAKEVDEVPAAGFEEDEQGYQGPTEGNTIDVVVNSSSERLELLTPFKAWDGQDLTELPVLLKAKGKCTTDHISPAGKWLRFRGHLDNISNNMFTGAINAFTGEAGMGVNQLNGNKQPHHEIARAYKDKGLGWVAVGDENYGEGSSREHAAMSPRLLGCRAVIVRSFARIHQTNLKKQGILPLEFANPADYDLIEAEDKISILGLNALAPGKPVTVRILHKDGSTADIQTTHTLNEEQIAWFEAGSALNVIRSKAA
jgi:aconitate hydratase